MIIENKNELIEFITNHLMGEFDIDSEQDPENVIDSVQTYQELGMLSNDTGLVITLLNGKEFTIVINER